ncbi:MAG: hypothetical protein IPL46_14725 [Saprospiraceae bacterium]|nr:hypothetical protein [Saprospiraceae bacterium]
MLNLIIAFVGLFSIVLNAQVVLVEHSFKLTLRDGTIVQMVPGSSKSGVNTYYYFPVNLRLSKTTNGEPEFSFLTYENKKDQPVEGSILHFLLVWGLTAEQEREVVLRLETRDSLAVLNGCISLEIPSKGPSMAIEGKNEIAGVLQKSTSLDMMAALTPGTKMAFAYHLNADQTNVFQKAMKQPASLKEVTVALNFRFHGISSSRSMTEDSQLFGLKTDFKNLFAPVLHHKKNGP